MHTTRLLARLSLVLGGSLALVSGVHGCSSDDANGTGACQRALPAPTQGTTYCRTKADCPASAGDSCTAETAPQSCGGVGPPRCTSDEECLALIGPKSVCETTCRAPCESDMSCGSLGVCDVATGHCGARACDDSLPCPPEGFCGASKTCQYKECDPAGSNSCGVARVCDPATFSCVSAPCSGDADCPEVFACEAGRCGPRSCACDGECGASGYCVRGTCSTAPGYCQGTVACGRPLHVEGGSRLASVVVMSGWGLRSPGHAVALFRATWRARSSFCRSSSVASPSASRRKARPHESGPL